MKWHYIKSDNYKGYFFETKFSLNISYDTEGSLNYQIITEYFIDNKKIKFKDINKTINRFNISKEARSDLNKFQGIDAIKELIDKEIDYLKNMFDSDLVERVEI